MFNHLCLDSSSELCAEDPDGNGPLTGADVLAENVRQLCIHHVHKAPDQHYGEVHFAEKFWAYIERFIDACPLDGSSPQRRFGIECSANLMKQVGIDIPRVDECVRVNTTSFLQKERGNQAWSTRALRINGWRYSGMMDADLITKAICSGFTVEPEECTQLVKPRDPFQPYYITKVEGLQFSEMLQWLLVLSALMAVLMFLYKRNLGKTMRTTVREEVMLEVQAQMGEYVKMGSKV